MLPIGKYEYEIRLEGELVAVEQSSFDAATIIAARRSADGRSRHRLEAALDTDNCVRSVKLSYTSSLFTRKASYETVDDHFSGRISGVAGRNEVAVKLGRFHEVDVAGFLIFRALIIGHVRLRGVEPWTGRVAVVDPNTLAVALIKQNCARRNHSDDSWIYEPGMGDAEQIELDQAGRIVRRRDNRGLTAELMVQPRDASR
jgi:hypothetical protein